MKPFPETKAGLCTHRCTNKPLHKRQEVSLALKRFHFGADKMSYLRLAFPSFLFDLSRFLYVISGIIYSRILENFQFFVLYGVTIE